MTGLHSEELSEGRADLRQEALHPGRVWAAQTIPIWVEDIVEAGAVEVMVDNSGFVWAHTRGCSRDEYIYTLAKYIEVSKGTAQQINMLNVSCLGHACGLGCQGKALPHWQEDQCGGEAGLHTITFGWKSTVNWLRDYTKPNIKL